MIDRPDLAGMTFACPKCTGLFVVPAPLAVAAPPPIPPPIPTPMRAEVVAPPQRVSRRSFYVLLVSASLLAVAAFVVIAHPNKLPGIARAIAPESDQEMIARVMNSVVTVRTHRGHGSGFFVRDNQTVATNFHVIDGATSATVELSDGTIWKVSGFSACRPYEDIVILKLAKPATILEPLRISPEMPKQGSRVFTFGAPGGMKQSVSDGIVSAVRTVEQIDESTAGKRVGLLPSCKVIQITAPISPGSSGGPLTTEYGDVIGINSAFYAERHSQNINFAVSCISIASAIAWNDETQPLYMLPQVP
jgi:serine protease Do